MHSYMQDYILCLCIIQVEAWALFQKISFISEEYVITIYLSTWAPAGIFVGGSEPQKGPPQDEKGPPPKKKLC